MACCNIRGDRGRTLLLLIAACSLLHQAAAVVELPAEAELEAVAVKPPVTDWLLPAQPAEIAAMTPLQRVTWRRIGAKLWTFLSTMDHDYVDAQGRTVPPPLSTKRVFGPEVTCGRFARQWIRMPFHDCGTFDVGNTGSEGSSARARFGCNGSLRKEIAPCLRKGPECINGVEARYDLATGKYLNETVFASLEAKYGAAVDWAFDKQVPRMENSGMAQSMAFFYQMMFEERHNTRVGWSTQPSYADIMMYAGMLAVAKCGGPQIEFQPGRIDAIEADAPARLPNPVAPLSFTISYFWTNGLTNFDMVNLLAAHSTACFSVGCLDNSPNKLNAEWALNVLAINSENDPRICQFPHEVANLTMPAPALTCVLPADVELNARADIAPYLRALAGQETLAEAATRREALPTCPLQDDIVNRGQGSCESQRGVPPFAPFRLLTLPEGSVNLCNRPTAMGCSAETRSPFHDAFATSFFKMSKMYAVRGVNMGAPFGVQTQPCQPGLIKVGEVIPPSHPGEFTPPMNPNPRCSCCPNPPPQRFYFAHMKNGAGRAGHANVATAADVPLSNAEGWEWYAENMAYTSGVTQRC